MENKQLANNEAVQYEDIITGWILSLPHSPLTTREEVYRSALPLSNLMMITGCYVIGEDRRASIARNSHLGVISVIRVMLPTPPALRQLDDQ